MNQTQTVTRAGPIWNLLEQLKGKDGVSEVAINGEGKVFAEVKGQFTQLNVKLSLAEIEQFCHDLQVLKAESGLGGAKLNGRPKVLDTSLDDGARVHIVYPPYAPHGPAISIRRFNNQIKTLDEHASLFSIDAQWASFFKAMVRARMNVVVCGGTGSGKTTFLNLLLQEIPMHERVLTIEDVLELKLSLPNQVRLLAPASFDDEVNHLTIRDLVRSSLRMRPDRLVIGEVRGVEAFDLLMAWNTGHEGSFTSIHANSALEAVQRLESLFMLAGTGISLVAARKLITNAVDFVLFIQKDRMGKRRVMNLIELTGMEGPTILSQSIAEQREGQLCLTGVSQKVELLQQNGGLDKAFFQNQQFVKKN